MDIQAEVDFLLSKRLDLTKVIDGWDTFYRFIESAYGKRLVFLYFRATLSSCVIFVDLGRLAGLDGSDLATFMTDGVVSFMGDHILLGIDIKRGEVDARRLEVELVYE